MSWARSRLRSALSLAAISARGATTEGAARRGLSAWPAPQEPSMEYQVSDPRAGKGSRTDTWAGREPRCALRQLLGAPEPEVAGLGRRGRLGIRGR